MERFLICAMDIGEQMLISGAEVHRVEESIERMCYSFGALRVDVFTITSSMVVTVYTKDGSQYTTSRRITNATTDFEKIHLLNELCREICDGNLTLEKIKKRLKEISRTGSYPYWLVVLSYGLVVGSFTLFFGGTFLEAAVSFVVGLLVRLAVSLSEKAISNKIFGKFLASALASVLAFLALKMNIIPTVDNLIIGNIMTLIPGIGLTNALRDLFTGDSIAGLLRSIEAVLFGLAIAAGYFLVAVIGGMI